MTSLELIKVLQTGSQIGPLGISSFKRKVIITEM